MRFNCGRALYQKLQDDHDILREWHPFFALLPRRVSANQCRWLEWIERKGHLLGISKFKYWYEFQYRAKS